MDYISRAIHLDYKSSNIPRTARERVPAWCGCSSSYRDIWGRLSIYLIGKQQYCIHQICNVDNTCQVISKLYDSFFFKGNVTLPYFLASLLNNFRDGDCPKEHLVLSISKYSSDEVHCMRFTIVIDQITMYYIAQ